MVSVIYHPRQHCGKLEVVFCWLVIETAAPAFAETNERQSSGYIIVHRGTGYESRRTSKAVTKLLQFMLEGPQPCTIFSLTLTSLVEYFNGDVSFGQLLQHFSKPIVVCAPVKPENNNKNRHITKKCIGHHN